MVDNHHPSVAAALGELRGFEINFNAKGLDEHHADRRA
jgi:hypothetical protein